MRTLILAAVIGGAAIALSTTGSAAPGSGPAPGTITTIAGGGIGDGGPATDAAVMTVRAIAFDADDKMYFVEDNNHEVFGVAPDICRVREVSNGIISTVAGGTCGYGGDGGPATEAMLQRPQGLAVGDDGSLYIADTSNCRIRRVADGIITTVAGDGTCLSGGDGGPATLAQIQDSWDVAIDVNGDLLIAETSACRVRRVSDGIITTVTGGGGCQAGPDEGDIATLRYSFIYSIDVDHSSGDIYLGEANGRIRRISGSSVSTVASGYPVEEPIGIAARHAGEVFIADRSTGLLRVTPSTVQVVFSPFSEASRPRDVAIDGTGGVYFSSACRVVRYEGGEFTTVAGRSDWCDYTTAVMSATNAALASPGPLDIDTDGNLYFFERGRCHVRSIDRVTELISVEAGTGSCVSLGHTGADGSPPTSTRLGGNTAVAFDGSGTLHVIDGCRIRAVVDGLYETRAGMLSGSPAFPSSCKYDGDDVPATEASLNRPAGIGFDDADNLYIADTRNCRIRMVDAGTGVITTIAGIGDSLSDCGYSGDGGAATEAMLDLPAAVAVGPDGDIYIADAANCVVRVVSNGVIDTLAGDGTCGFGGDGGPATAAQLGNPVSIAVDEGGVVYIGEECRIRRVAEGVISTIAGSATCGFAGDGGHASEALLDGGIHVTIGGDTLYVSDPGNRRVRAIELGACGRPCLLQATSGDGSTTVGGIFAGAPNTTYTVTLHEDAGCSGTGAPVASAQAQTNPIGDGRLDSLFPVEINAGGFAAVSVAPNGEPGSPHSACIEVVERPCTDDSDCDGLTDEEEIAAGMDPFQYCAISRGDVNGDGVVNILDVSLVSGYFGQTIPPAPERYAQGPAPLGDAINILDLSKIGGVFGKQVNACP